MHHRHIAALTFQSLVHCVTKPSTVVTCWKTAVVHLVRIALLLTREQNYELFSKTKVRDFCRWITWGFCKTINLFRHQSTMLLLALHFPTNPPATLTVSRTTTISHPILFATAHNAGRCTCGTPRFKLRKNIKLTNRGKEQCENKQWYKQ